MKKLPRILFLGTPAIAAYVLQGIIDDGYPLVGVIAQPDKLVGRKKVLEPVPTKKVALAHNIPVFQPIKVRLDYQFAAELKPDLIICFAYGQIIPQGLLDLAPLGALNLHGSLLPKYRGASPMQMALVNDEQVTGITLMQMIDKMDAGLMYAKQPVEIAHNDNYTSLAEKMKVAALTLIRATLPRYLEGQLPGVAQDEQSVTFAGLIKREQEHLDLNLPKARFRGWVRALSEEPGGYLYWNEIAVKLLEVELVNEEVQAPVGTIIRADKTGLHLQCSDGVIAINRLQLPGKTPVSAKAFVNGYPSVFQAIWR